MNSLNKIQLIGRVGKDPEARSTNTGKAVTNLTVATSEQFKDAAGEKKEKTEWHKVVLWDKLAQIVNNYVKKGNRIYIEGKVTYREYIDKENTKRFVTEIVATNIILLENKPAANGPAKEEQQHHEARTLQAGPTIDDSEIPF